MHSAETYILHAMCLRLVLGLDPARGEALGLAGWIAAHTTIFGAAPPIISNGRRQLGVDPQGWQRIGDHLAGRLQTMAEPVDQSLDRLRTISTHLGLTSTEETILRFLTLQQRRGTVAEFAAMLKRQFGLSDEAMIACCCNLDEQAIWKALSPRGRLVTLGLVQTDSMLAELRDDPYTLSGLLLALIRPPMTGGVLTGQGHDRSCHLTC